MDAIILAGGKGTRLKEVITDIPKPLAPINGIPFLDLLIVHLQSFEEINRIILSVGHKKGKIINRYNGLENILFSQEDSSLGTGGAIKKALHIANSANVLVLNGDTFIQFSLKAFLNFHLEKNSDISILSNFEKDTSRYGFLNFDEKNNMIKTFDEKTNRQNGYINSGVYLLHKEIFTNDKLPDLFSLEKDFFPIAVKEKKVFGFKISSPFIDIGTEESYFQAQNILKITSI